MTLLDALADHVRKRELRRALLDAPPAPAEEPVGGPEQEAS